MCIRLCNWCFNHGIDNCWVFSTIWNLEINESTMISKPKGFFAVGIFSLIWCGGSFSYQEKKILQELIKFLKKCKPKITSEEIQNEIYELGKKYKYELKDWFLFLYETLLGQKNGPRLGTFILLLSIKETIKLIEDSFSR